MGFVICLGHDIYFLVGKHSMKKFRNKTLRLWSPKRDLGGFTSHALAPRGSRGQHLSVPGIPGFPHLTTWRCAWVFKLRQLLWQDVSMFVVVGMDVSFSLRNMEFKFHAWNLKITNRVWTVLKMANLRHFFKPSQQANLMLLVSGSYSFKVFSQHRFVCLSDQFLPNSAYCVHRRLNSAERFNPMTGAWEALPPMQERRFLGLLIPWKKQSNLGMFCPCWWNDTVDGSKIRRSPRGRYKTL